MAHGGRTLSRIERGSGFDVIGYNPRLGHLYLAGSSCRCMVTLGVNRHGKLGFIARISAPSSTHCAVADDSGNAWLCDPDRGRVVRIADHNAKALD